MADLTYSNDEVEESFAPCIFVPNVDIAGSNKQPIFSPGIEADCSSDSTLEDHIVAWYLTEEGAKVQVFLDEDESLTTTNPIFILDNGDPNPQSNSSEIQPPDDDLKSILSTTYFHSCEYRINYHYENWPDRPDFTIVAYRIDPQGVIHWIYNAGGWKLIAKVKRSDVGTDLAQWEYFCNNYTPYNQNYVYWNTFERDWNRSEKLLGDAYRNGTTLHLYGQRKYYYEWYSIDPSQLQINNTDLSYIYTNWAKWHNNYKSKYRIWRVEL
ncbi:MAG: hypothetical protein V1733_03955 [bacterium]